MLPLELHSATGISGPLLLIILDGFGLYRGQQEGYPGNAIDLADAPTLKRLLANAPVRTTLKAHGTAVGMPSDADMGNSEVGHNAMGAGRIFDQGAKLVQESIESGALFQGETWMELIGSRANPGHAIRNPNCSVHLIGLLSDGNVHSHIDHLIAMLQKCAEEGIQRVLVHTLLDGRDVAGKSAQIYIKALEDALGNLQPDGGVYAIASGGGRMQITMDRYEADWAMVERGWQTHVKGAGRMFGSAEEALVTLRQENPEATDQDLPAFVIEKDSAPLGPIRDDDVVIFFNFRGDRAIEISRAFTEESFQNFKRDPDIRVRFAGMLEYDGDLHIPPAYLLAPPQIERTLTEYLVHSGVRQFAISETQKFGHVTYFWNGNNSNKFDENLEVWKEIPSDSRPFNQQPRMRADEITDEVLGALQGDFQFLRANYANGDMVGHTGDLQAAVAAVEALDENIKRLLRGVEESGATAILTADHGNCDEMIQVDKSGTPILDSEGAFLAKTSHTLNPVPFILLGKEAGQYQIAPGDFGLANLAATILMLLGFAPPSDYEPSILQHRNS